MSTPGRRATGVAVLGVTLLMAAGLAAPRAAAQAGHLAACERQVGTRVAANGWPVPAVDLARGSRGDCVRALQWALVGTAFVDSADAPTFIDGDFGPKTEAAVRRFQSTYPRETGGPDGIVGLKTWGYLIPAAAG
ncbi:peptidoglycan-binding protein [Streptomyces sp. NPDC097619]|uniref:peptidoglycan-binding domain-containing protein n=1 Tax=Streptomyces sp. NPDC097619 TaxID=3157228 RepID=UPI0033239083